MKPAPVLALRRVQWSKFGLGLTNTPRCSLAEALIAVALAACSSAEPTKSQSTSPLLGTWAEIVTARPANASDGRQVIERKADGSFKLVFVRTHPAQSPCTGSWSHSGTAYRMIFSSLACFGGSASKPEVGKEVELEVLEASSNRLRFKVPAGAPFAAWQAKLEGGIE